MPPSPEPSTTSQPMLARRWHWMNHLERHATMQPTQVALRFEGNSTTWARLSQRVHALAADLSARGVHPGDRVAVVMGNRPELVESLLAVNLLGAIAVPLNFRLAGPEAAYVLADCGSLVALVDELGLPVVQSAGTTDLQHVVVVGDPPPDSQQGAGRARLSRYREAIGDATARPELLPDVPEDAPALILYTSGTTGRPKGAVLTHLNMQSQSVTVTRALSYVDGDERNLIASPLFHVGAIGSLLPNISTGATTVIAPTRAFDAAHVLELIETERVTSAFLVPTQWQALCEHPDAATRDLEHLRVMAWGAAPATDHLLRQMAETFPAASNVALFGQTEMSPVTCVLHGRDSRRKLGSVGRPVTSVTARVVDPLMEDVAPGEVGEIVYRGQGLMRGYWNKPDETREAFEGGWFHSGDLVRVDEDGYVYVVDRLKDMIISGGENVYCAEVENVLADHPDVVEVTVVGEPHPVWGETPVAYLVLRDGADDLTLEDLRDWATESLARYKLPTRMEHRTILPRNASGKVLKQVLRAEATSSTTAPPQTGG